MEGPTSSSAIFYGSLSVHLGVFLLLRTYPYWESIIGIKIFIITVGLITSIIASFISKIQSTVKTQIAYSSIAQIGIMFIEVALGWHVLALIHFAGNAFLRTYQLLVSPSVLGYLVHDMFFNFQPNLSKSKSTILGKIKNTIYILSVKEWNLDKFLMNVLWNPFKWLGKHLDILNHKLVQVLLGIIFILGIFCELNQANIPIEIFELLPEVYSFLALLLILKTFAERGSAIRAWFTIIVAQLFLTLSIALLNEDFGNNHMAIYLSGTVASSIVGFMALYRIKYLEKTINLNQHSGHVYEHPKTAFVFLIACLGLIGLPFTPTFVGIDILFSHIHKHEIIHIVFTTLSFLVIEVAILRIYSRLFLGQHTKKYHPIAYRSS
jgi:NADH:ubiquinone oxidoreductase subunit 5 (subunit L)/multisubunit Na+/H+ antiporter MnhA subunit